MGTRRLSLAVTLAVVLAMGSASNAHACSCAAMAPGEALRQADAAIVGELVRVVPRSRQVADFRFRVKRVHKGRTARGRIGGVISVRSALQSAACGLPRRTGRRYGLLLSRVGGRWVGGLCGLMAPGKLRSAARLACQDRGRWRV